jgi:hypothetical protein
MTLAQMLAALRKQLSDEQKVGWPDDAELHVYLDRAADTLTERLVTAKDPTRLKTVRINGLADLPADFISFAGNVPVSITGRKCASYGGPVDAKYWSRLPWPSQSGTYTPDQELMIIDLARIYALNRNEYDVAQDVALNTGGR